MQKTDFSAIMQLARLLRMMMMMMILMIFCVMKRWVRQRLCWGCVRRRHSSSEQRRADVESAEVRREARERNKEARPLWALWRAGTRKERQASQAAETTEGIALQLRDFLSPVFKFCQTMQQCMHLWLSCLMWDKTSDRYLLTSCCMLSGLETDSVAVNMTLR